MARLVADRRLAARAARLGARICAPISPILAQTNWGGWRMKTLSALSVRKKFGSVLDDVVRTREPVVIARANKPLVVMLPAEDFPGDGQAPAREARLRLAAARLAEWRRRHGPRLKELDPVAALRRDRDRK